MDIFLLGAGRPAKGYKPSALKQIALKTKAIDWQIHSFEAVNEDIKMFFLGGYQVEEIIKNYPQLNYTVIAEWEHRSVLNTFLNAPFSKSSVVISYTDTVFRKEVIVDLVQNPADVVFGIDSNWTQRYQSRLKADIDIAEKIDLAEFNAELHGIVEFTGLIYFNALVVD